jgi:hypothetical protein
MLGLAPVVGGRCMALALVLAVLSYKVATLDAPGFAL